MEITLKEITIRELAAGYVEDTGTGRVSGFGGKLDIRPIYQREFVYKPAQRDAVIDTVFKSASSRTAIFHSSNAISAICRRTSGNAFSRIG